MLKLSVLRGGVVAQKIETSLVHEVIEEQGDTPLDAWRRAFERSTGDVVLCLPPDASLAPDHCHRLLARLEEAPEIGAVFFRQAPEQPAHLVAARLLGTATLPEDEGGALRELLEACPLLRRSYVESTDLFGSRRRHGRSPEEIWVRLKSGEQRVGPIDRTLLAGEYAALAMRSARAGAAAAARVRLRMLEAAEDSASLRHSLIMRTALRSTESMSTAELESFLLVLRSVLSPSLVNYLRAMRDAEAGFSAFRAGNIDGALRGMVRAFRGAPQLAMNVGAWSVFGRACLSRLGVTARREDVQQAVQQVGRALQMRVLGVADTGTGTNHNTYLLQLSDERVLLRLLRPPHAARRAEALAGVLRQLHAQGVRAPRMRAHGLLGDGDAERDAAWVAEEFIESEVSEAWLMSHADAVHMAQSIGRALRRVHELPAPSFGLLHSKKSIEFAAWLEDEMLHEPGADVRLTHDVHLRLSRARELLLSSPHLQPSLLHADLWPGNYLVQSDGECALIDWASAQGGDPAFDIAVWYLALHDRDLLEHLLRAYAPDSLANFRRRVDAYADLYAASLLTAKFSQQRIDAARLRVYARQWLDRSAADHREWCGAALHDSVNKT